jgi:hypothetical protein
MISGSFNMGHKVVATVCLRAPASDTRIRNNKFGNNRTRTLGFHNGDNW